MHDLAILFIHLLVTVARLMRLGGARAVVAESLLVKHQLVILNRGNGRVHPTSVGWIESWPDCVQLPSVRASYFALPSY